MKKWFRSRQKQLEMIQALRPTSKATLKMQCLIICKADIGEAEKLYDFFAKDMPDLPDFDPAPQTWMDNTKDMANGIVGWLGSNKDTLVQAYDFIRGITGNRLPPLSLPMDATVPEAEATPLPPINKE